MEGVFKEVGAGVCGEAREWEDAAGLGEARSRWWWEDKEVAEINMKGVKGHVNTDNEDLFPPYLFVHITRSKGSMYHFQKAPSAINSQKSTKYTLSISAGQTL